MEINIEPANGKRRKLMSQTKNQSNGRVLIAVESLGGVKVEEFEAVSSANTNAGSTEQDTSWPDTLPEAQLNLLVSIKQLAMERLISTGDTGLEEVLPASALQTIGILMEELVKDRVRKLANSHKTGKSTINASQEHATTESMDDNTP